MRKIILASLLLACSQGANAQAPNLDFEKWISSTHEVPDGWLTNNIHLPVTSISVLKTNVGGGVGIRLISESTFSPDPGSIMNSNGNYLTARGGGALTTTMGIPTHLKGAYKYDIATGDSARMYVILKKNGFVMTFDSFFVKGSQGSYTTFNMPLSPMSSAPDTIIFAAFGGASAWSGASRASKYLELDYIELTNGTGSYNIPNGDFDNWPTVTEEEADAWFSMGDVTKTTDKYSGTYAVRLMSSDASGVLERASLFSMEQSMSSQYVDTLVGYYKFASPATTDYGQIAAAMWDGDPNTPPQAVTYNLLPAASYTYFSLPLVNTIGASKLYINIHSSSGGFMADSSTLYVDKMAIKKGKSTNVHDVNSNSTVAIYPNPARDVLQVSVGSATNAKVTITNMAGTVVYSATAAQQQLLSIPLQNWQPGIYLYEVRQDGSTSRGKFTKE
ncbi:MAG: T9SS type A sorting domain-containing protein [Sphingobacteriales bacterium]|nr:MAG: T9SS type A sorting domain-containing protein [Sphingobacteriales bacterium]